MTTTKSSFDEILTRCESQRVTGILHVMSDSEEAQIHFLSGIRESIRIGTEGEAVESEEALRRISGLPNPRFRAIASLPPMSERSGGPLPEEGKLGKFRPVELMRYCEDRCLTCTLHLECVGKQLQATYELGELKRIEPDEHMTISVLEATEGEYRFTLPQFELPDLTAPRPANVESWEVAQKGLGAPPVEPETEDLGAPLSARLLEQLDEADRVPPAAPTKAEDFRRWSSLALAALVLAGVVGAVLWSARAGQTSDAEQEPRSPAQTTVTEQ